MFNASGAARWFSAAAHTAPAVSIPVLTSIPASSASAVAQIRRNRPACASPNAVLKYCFAAPAYRCIRHDCRPARWAAWEIPPKHNRSAGSDVPRPPRPRHVKRQSRTALPWWSARCQRECTSSAPLPKQPAQRTAARARVCGGTQRTLISALLAAAAGS